MLCFIKQFIHKTCLFSEGSDLSDSILTPNPGLKIKLAKKITLNIKGNYNPFTFSEHKKFMYWLEQSGLHI
ncbi:MAG: DUF3575 domain-containing protein [Tannerella sp.]|jgi:hypothetical protein|nr:DUF3575 domain-containing protein [Tannerella sp.]